MYDARCAHLSPSEERQRASKSGKWSGQTAIFGYSDATRPRLRDGVPLSGSLPRHMFRYYIMCETGSDELMELASDLATHFGHEGPTHDIPGTR